MTTTLSIGAISGAILGALQVLTYGAFLTLIVVGVCSIVYCSKGNKAEEKKA